MFKKLLLTLLLAAPLSLCAQKFAHFDYAAIIQAMPEAKAAQADLEALYKQYQAELENMQKELQTKMEKYQKEDTEATPANIREPGRTSSPIRCWRSPEPTKTARHGTEPRRRK